jgi:CRP/FNR family transcriptional regulator, dissimilatory nitrate respiration regulator
MSTNGNQANSNGRDPRLVEGLLSSLPLFQQVARTQVRTIASHSRIQYLRRGAALCRRGERLPGVIAMGYGIMKLALRRPGGDEKVVRFLNANETFGESAALLDRPCPVDVIALEDSMIAVMPAAPLLRLIELDPKFAHNIVRSLAAKFLGLLHELEASVNHSGLQRLARYLESLAVPNGARDTWIVHLPASKTAVAARLGMTKETISRLLRELVNRGLISVSRRDIQIFDRAALTHLSS